MILDYQCVTEKAVASSRWRSTLLLRTMPQIVFQLFQLYICHFMDCFLCFVKLLKVILHLNIKDSFPLRE